MNRQEIARLMTAEGYGPPWIPFNWHPAEPIRDCLVWECPGDPAFEVWLIDGDFFRCDTRRVVTRKILIDPPVELPDSEARRE